MVEAGGAGPTSEDLLRDAWEFWKQDRPHDALDAAWAAFDLAPEDCATKAFLAELLRFYPAQLQADRRAAYLRLLTDRKVEPDLISTAGWQLLLRSSRLAENSADAVLEALITDLERDELALALLRESPVSFAAAERLLARLRRWLLLSGRWRRHPAIVTALKAQASLNGGAWPFDELERTRLGEEEGSPMVAAYLPVRAAMRSTTAADTANPVTRAVTAQYEGWPYPAWTRITVGKKRRLPDVIQAMDPEQAKALPIEADMLIAGCGTGRQAAGVAVRYPEASITAIDVSEASLDYARRQCATLGIANVRFFKLDLHDVAGLNQRFHAIHCGGVLHHLSDPEHGLKILADVLHPGGVMRIMVYNRHRRLMILGARALLISDLLQEPVSDDILRQVRQRFLEQPEHPAAAYVTRSRDFATLAGTHDLLLHRHEDPFDIKRIERALDRAGMRLLSFDIPSPAVAARYDSAFPDDPKHRDIKSWASFELSHPSIYPRNYTFWCGIPPDSH
jgi:ubiquinone/menaquinone biosynthesis C-methylase UbiE